MKQFLADLLSERFSKHAGGVAAVPDRGTGNVPFQPFGDGHVMGQITSFISLPIISTGDMNLDEGLTRLRIDVWTVLMEDFDALQGVLVFLAEGS